MKELNTKLFVSVDLDEWYFGRWATGSKYSLYPDVKDLLREVYKDDKPSGELNKPARQVLELFDKLNFKSTFFITGFVASHYPHLVKEIAAAGHEVACHNFYHVDYEFESREKFREDLKNSKNLLEDLSGQKIIGYRSPNSSIPPTLIPDLEEFGFLYDSSVTPTRRFMGKFGSFTNAPNHPYRTSRENVGLEGDSGIIEFPWPVFPLLKLPSGSGITHRIFGSLYNRIAVNSAIKKGHSAYYFHPYELAKVEHFKDRKLPLKAHAFMRSMGDKYFRMLDRFLEGHRDRLINGKGLYEMIMKEPQFQNKSTQA